MGRPPGPRPVERETMRDPIQPKQCARQLSALAAPERLRIIRFLRSGPHNVTEIAAHLKSPPVNVSHHLSVLRQAGVVRARKQGRFVHYSLAPGFLTDAGDSEVLNLGCCRLEVPGHDPAPPGCGEKS
jgi:DNA-binding transcriptional ArsR family regulator